MKKILTIAILVLIMGTSLPLVHAQTVNNGSTAQTTVNTAALTQLLNYLLQELALLQQEYAILVQQQTANGLAPAPALTAPKGDISTAASTTNNNVVTPPPTTDSIVVTPPPPTCGIDFPCGQTAPVVPAVKLSAQEQNFVILFASKIRTNDATNCPSVNNSTSTQNIANIDAYVNENYALSHQISFTDNGQPMTWTNKFGGGYPANPGDLITVSGNLTFAYCLNESVQGPKQVLATIAPMSSMVTFTLPSDSDMSAVNWRQFGFFVSPFQLNFVPAQ